MNEAPDQMTLAKLEVLVMPNGEVLCNGSAIGYVQDLGKYLSEPKAAV